MRAAAVAALALALAGAAAAQSIAAFTNPFENKTQNTGYCGYTTSGCVGKLNAALQLTTYSIGETIPMVISVTHFNNVTNLTETVFAEFFPTVDSYSLLDIPDSALVSVTQPNITLNIITQNGFLAMPIRQWSDGVNVVGFRSVVITLANGKISDAVWDDGEGCTNVCSSSQCVDNACLIMQPPASCGYGCDIKIYVTWQGTDVNNIQLTSANYAYYQFQRWWPFNQMSLVNSISLIFQNLGNGGFNELDNWLFF